MSDQWIRKIGLYVQLSQEEFLDLSAFHIRFEVANADVESPNNASIRIYNLAKSTVKKLIEQGEFTQVTLNAGYINGNYGTIFQGNIKQFRIGKESAVDTYLDILAADGDIFYTNAIMNDSIAKNTTPKDHIKVIADKTNTSVDMGNLVVNGLNNPSLRGKVMFGLARGFLRNVTSKLDTTWSIQNGVLEIIPKNGYLEDEVVELSANTGLIGIPEQTDEGVRMKCLLNSKLRIGRLVNVNNNIVNKTLAVAGSDAQIAYDSYSVQHLGAMSDDGTYRMLVVEHEGDTRGGAWYSNIVGLAFDVTNKTTLAQ